MPPAAASIAPTGPGRLLRHGRSRARPVRLRAAALTLVLGVALAPELAAGQTPAQDAFFLAMKTVCNARFEGHATFPEDPGDAFRGKTLLAIVEGCGASEIRIPFHVGEDRSRTWILRRVEDGLELKHDHRHADGTPDEVTMYGGTTRSPGTAATQSFPADSHTKDLIPEAATNEWFLTLSADGNELTYYLERHGKRRFKAVLGRVR